MASRLPNASARKTAVRSPTKRIPSAVSTRGSGFFLEFSMLRTTLAADFLPMRSSVISFPMLRS